MRTYFIGQTLVIDRKFYQVVVLPVPGGNTMTVKRSRREYLVTISLKTGRVLSVPLIGLD